MTRNGSTCGVPPEGSISAWSMWLAPATMACTRVNTLRPGRAPPTLPVSRTFAFTKRSSRRRTATVPTSSSPALATRFGSSKLTRMRSMACDTRLTEKCLLRWRPRRIKHRHRRCSGGTFRGYAAASAQVNRWIEAKRRPAKVIDSIPSDLLDERGKHDDPRTSYQKDARIAVTNPLLKSRYSFEKDSIWRWIIDRNTANGAALSLDTPEELVENRVSSGNFIEPLLDGRDYLHRWFEELDTLERTKEQALLVHAAWRLHDVAPDGRLDRGGSLYSRLRAFEAQGGHCYVRLSGHARGLANIIPRIRLRDLYSVALDRFLALPSSNHEKFTAFVTPAASRAMIGSIDLSKTRWDTSEHHSVDTGRYLLGRPTHDTGAFISGPAAFDIAEAFVRHHEGYRSQFRPTPQERIKVKPTPTLREPLSRQEPFGATVQILRTVPKRLTAAWPPREFGVWQAYTNALSQARDYIYIEDQYFWPFVDAPVDTPGQSYGKRNPLGLLVSKIREGVDLIVLLPHPGTNISPYKRREFLQRHLAMSALLRAQGPDSGRVLYACPWRGETPIYVHSKLLLCDDEYTLIGSANLNRRGMFSDFEMSAGVADAPFSRELRTRLWAEHLGLDHRDLSVRENAFAILETHLIAGHGNIRPYPLNLIDSALAGSPRTRYIWDALYDPNGRPF